MLREGYSFVLQAPWLAFAAGGAIFLVVLASQTLADGLQAVRARRGTRRAAPIDGNRPTALAAVLRRVLPGRRAAKA